MKRFIALVIAGLASIGAAMAAVNVNTASKEDLEALKDVGPVRAQAIVDYRNRHGAFRSLEDLDRVPGIGKATIDAIRKDVTFSGPRDGKHQVTIAKNDRDIIDINSASEQELKKLPGVSTLRAKAIVHGRPWRSKNDLVDKHVLPDHVYEGVKDRIVARHNPNDGNSGG